MLEEDGFAVDKVEGYSLWAVCGLSVSGFLCEWFDVVTCDEVEVAMEMGVGGTNIFIASNCSFFGTTSSIYGVRRG